MQRLTATEAARRFSDVLDAVEMGRESFVVVRRGREVATISPAVAATGKRLNTLLDQHRPDPGWSRELQEMRASLVEDADAWSD